MILFIQNPGINFENWNYYKIKNQIIIMKLTNLFNHEGNKTFSIKSYTKLDNAPVISNISYAEDCSEELLHPELNDAAKENRAYLGLFELLGLDDLSFKELKARDSPIPNRNQINFWWIYKDSKF